MFVNFTDVVTETGVSLAFSGHHSGFEHVKRVASNRANRSGDGSCEEFLDDGFTAGDFFNGLIEAYMRTIPSLKLV